MTNAPTWAHEQTAHSNHVIEMALAHAVGTGIEKVYRRADLFNKRRKLMEQWAAYCCSPPAVTGRWCRGTRVIQRDKEIPGIECGPLDVGARTLQRHHGRGQLGAYHRHGRRGNQLARNFMAKPSTRRYWRYPGSHPMSGASS